MVVVLEDGGWPFNHVVFGGFAIDEVASRIEVEGGFGVSFAVGQGEAGRGGHVALDRADDLFDGKVGVGADVGGFEAIDLETASCIAEHELTKLTHPPDALEHEQELVARVRGGAEGIVHGVGRRDGMDTGDTGLAHHEFTGEEVGGVPHALGLVLALGDVPRGRGAGTGGVTSAEPRHKGVSRLGVGHGAVPRGGQCGGVSGGMLEVGVIRLIVEGIFVQSFVFAEIKQAQHEGLERGFGVLESNLVEGAPGMCDEDDLVAEVPIVASAVFPEAFKKARRRFATDEAGDGAVGSGLVPVFHGGAELLPGVLSCGQVAGGFAKDKITLVDVVGGVVEDVKYFGLADPSEPSLYLPVSQAPFRRMSFVLRTTADPESLMATVRREIQAVDPTVPVSQVSTLDRILSASVARERFSMILLVIFASVALLLAAVGVYGVISYGVSQRTTELGVRMALGAEPGDVLKLVLGQGARLALAGVGLGLVGAGFLSRVMASQLYGVSATDPATYAAVALALTGVALAAAYIPARRTARLDPVLALRGDGA